MNSVVSIMPSLRGNKDILCCLKQFPNQRILLIYT